MESNCENSFWWTCSLVVSDFWTNQPSWNIDKEPKNKQFGSKICIEEEERGEMQPQSLWNFAMPLSAKVEFLPIHGNRRQTVEDVGQKPGFGRFFPSRAVRKRKFLRQIDPRGSRWKAYAQHLWDRPFSETFSLVVRDSVTPMTSCFIQIGNPKGQGCQAKLIVSRKSRALRKSYDVYLFLLWENVLSHRVTRLWRIHSPTPIPTTSTLLFKRILA